MGISGDQALVVGIIGISMVLNIFSNIFQAFYQVKERMEYIGLGQLIYAVLLFCGIFGGIAFRFDIKGIALIYAGSSVLTLVFYIIVLICRFPREMPVLNRLDMHDEKRFLFKAFKQCWPVGLAVIFNGVYSWIDTVILSALQNPGEAGLYNASYRMLLTIYIIPGALSYAVFPLMARYYVKDRPMAELTMEKSIKYLFVLGIPIAVATALLAERFILLLYGDSFLSAAVGLRLMIWSIPFYFANVIFNNYFNVANKQTVYTIACILMALISTVLNLLFVPRLGLIAASSIRILTDLSGFIFFISQISLTGYKIKWKSSLLTVIKIIGACVIMALFINFLYNLNLLILMVFSVFIYFISLLALKMLDANDMKIIRQIIFIKW
jgi:O-antigen/teichoic acid export membrane protein